MMEILAQNYFLKTFIDIRQRIKYALFNFAIFFFIWPGDMKNYHWVVLFQYLSLQLICW